MKITVLAENTSVNESLASEHGLSLYIETESHRILFDMGQGSLFSENAEKLGIDLSLVDMAVISHGHYDHGGGLKRFLEINSCAPVYINRRAFGKYYNAAEKYIGLDTALQDSERLVFTDEEYKINECMTLYSCNSLKREYKTDPAGLTMMSDKEKLPDMFLHEQYLVIDENGKRTVISGCSHKGILNITDWLKPDILIGGFHLSKMPADSRLAECAVLLEKSGAHFYTCHCTGSEQYEYMKNNMTRLQLIGTGSVISI